MGLFDKILQQPQENNNMAELYVRYMISSNVSTSKVKPVLQRMLDTDPEADIARNQLLSYAIDADDDKEVMRLMQTIAAQNLFGQQGNDTTKVMGLFDKILQQSGKDRQQEQPRHDSEHVHHHG